MTTRYSIQQPAGPSHPAGPAIGPARTWKRGLVPSVTMLLAGLAGWGPGGVLAENRTQTAPPAAMNTVQANPAPAASPKASRRLEEEEVRDLLTAALNQRTAGDGAEWELRFTRPWTPVVVPDEPLRIEILEPAIGHSTATSILRFEIHGTNQLLGSWQVPVQAKLYREVLVAHANLQRGLPLADAPLTRERRDIIGLREPLSELPTNAVVFEIGEGVLAGAPLTARAIRLRPVVFRGQMADAVVRSGVMVISLKVEILEEGTPGQMIRVRNPQSRRELRGKVQDERTIAIPL